MSVKPLRVCPLVLLTLAAGLSHGEAPSKVGISAEKPTSGPFVETDHGFMVPYEQTIPGAGVKFKMTPIPGGVVTLGPRGDASEAEPNSQSPPVQVKIPPYWMATTEVTWAQYKPFMALNSTFGELAYLRGLLYDGSPKLEKALASRTALKAAIDATPTTVDGITAPTALYDPSTTYYSGEDPNLPAVTMTAYAARQYTKWLSVLTGEPYRLPSEAEWEHAARAGADGDAPAGDLDAAAWYEANSDYVAHPVGEKTANAFGLHDMIGNAAEWVLDVPHKSTASNGPLTWRQAIGKPEQQFPRIAKGGFYESEPADATFAARLLSVDEDWKASDPNIPLSPWWFTDDPSMGIGFRLVRPLEPMSEEVKAVAWEFDSPDLQRDVEQRVREGRGKLQSIDATLPEVVKQLADPDVRKLME